MCLRVQIHDPDFHAEGVGSGMQAWNGHGIEQIVGVYQPRKHGGRWQGLPEQFESLGRQVR